MDTPVIVVGAGPSGLVLAAELRLGGAPVIVLEKLRKRSGESRGLGFTARTLEMFDQRGLVPRFGEVETSPQGHFGGIPMDYSVLADAHFGARGIPQSRTEEVLEGWATGLGADIRRGVEVVGLTDDGEGVDVEAVGPDGPLTLRSRYVVACDGGHSTVRGLAGFEFPGTDSTIEMFLADVGGCVIEPRQIGEKVPGGMVMSAPLGDGFDRVIVVERGTPPRRRTSPPDFAEVADAWQRLTGQSLHGGHARWVSSFGDATRQVTRYRRGNVLIAGDAAHTHLPAGGQGLSVSVQDAFNLGWKLAATVRGRAPDGLLDSYHDERHPVGARLLMNTQAQGMLYLSGVEMEPLRTVFGELMDDPNVRRRLAGMVSGLDVRYDVGPGAHPLLGRRVPKVELLVGDTKTSTFELLHGGRPVLLRLRAGLEPAAGLAAEVEVVDAEPHGLPDGSPLHGTAALLVRPDGYVVWAGDDGSELRDAASPWFGPPR
ncbi:FAD-dependent monooxygenase [Actinomadura terrae]|uniref:FAD-dependent monooxygenase n=1 Tax=Actinomadura terrae TaxID=604353 RepID=UPI001FA793F5|nr:FAD-dependent monooxygenase [Actinomadura terrae]